MTYARHPQGSMPYRRILIALFFAGVATFAQLYSPQGVLPAIAADIGVSPATASLTISVATAGVALSTGAVSLLYFAYLAGTPFTSAPACSGGQPAWSSPLPGGRRRRPR